jgi:arginyl-tRNA synthetase
MKQELQKLIYKTTGKTASIEHPADPSHGDYSTNVALKVHGGKGAKVQSNSEPLNLGTSVPNPMEVANEIVNKIRSAGMPEYIAKIEVVQPGFINFWLSPEYLANQVGEVLKEKENFGRLTIGKGKTVIVDYSSPNIAKPFGIGHLRSTVIGQAIYNLYQSAGWRTIGDNHLGDWGTQFGKLIYQVQRDKGSKLQSLTIEKLEKMYVDFHKKAEKHPELEDEARKYFQMLEAGDKEARRIWQVCVDLSLKEFNRVYDLLGIKIDNAYGESFYEDKMPAVIERAKRKKLAVESQGALVIPFDELKIPPGILIKSDGATTYFTRDQACIEFRNEKWQPDLFIYEVGSDQKLHFQQVFAGAVKLGYGKKEQFVHVAHGLIRFPKGKMSTRAGTTVHLEIVLEEAIKRALKIIKKSATGRGISSKQQQEVARAVGIGAIKYFDLKHQPETDIIYDWENMFQLEGDSGPYLQYSFARCQSVLKKFSIFNFQFSKNYQYPNFNIEEIIVLRTLYRFPEVIQAAAETYSPNLLCNFLFDLAQKYNNFYNKHRIIGSGEAEEFRLALTVGVGQVLKNGLGILGIATPERM